MKKSRPANTFLHCFPDNNRKRICSCESLTFNFFNIMRTVAGLDVHKDSVFLCILQENGEKIEKKYGVLTPDLANLHSELQNHNVTEVGMESTSIYWLPVWRALEGISDRLLVNPYFIKQLPGRKSDVKDALWIAECVQKNLIRGSYVPIQSVQDLRLYNRRIFDIEQECTRKLHKLDAALQRCNIRMSNYLTRTTSKSYCSVVDAICRGVTSPKELIKLVHGKTITKHGYDTILSALTGIISPTDIDIFSQLKKEIDILEEHRKVCEEKMTQYCKEHYPQQLANILTIPGISTRGATSIIAELGVDMSAFPTASHLTSWCGLRPRNDQSNHTIMCRKITHGNKYIRQILIQCAWSASRCVGSFFNKFSYTQVQIKKKAQKKVTVAIARKLLVCVWHILTKNEPYKECWQ